MCGSWIFLGDELLDCFFLTDPFLLSWPFIICSKVTKERALLTGFRFLKTMFDGGASAVFDTVCFDCRCFGVVSVAGVGCSGCDSFLPWSFVRDAFEFCEGML